MYNPTCFFTGKKENLKMFAHRDDWGNMVGFIFVHDSIDTKNIILKSDYILNFENDFSEKDIMNKTNEFKNHIREISIKRDVYKNQDKQT